MGKYRAQLSLPNHLHGTTKVYDDDDAVVQHWVSTGALVRVDGPGEKPKKQSASQRRVKKAPAKKADAPVELDPEFEQLLAEEEEIDAAAKNAETETPVEEPKSSVMTSWTVSD